MPFRFSLQTLLRFRQSVERQWELRLQEANQQVIEVEREIETVQQRKAELARYELRQLSQGVAGAQLHFHTLVRSRLAERREVLQRELARRREARADCLCQLQVAHREREAVDALRESQLRIYRQEASRREQRRLDDLFLLRRDYLSRR